MKHIFGKLLSICMALGLFFAGCFAMKAEAAENADPEQLNFLVVESSYLEVPGEQKVAVSIGDGESPVTDAVLTYTNKDTGEVFERQADKIIEDAILFTMQFAEEAQTGIYELNSISYTMDGDVREIALAQFGQEIVFGVNKEAEGTAEAALETEMSAEDKIAVVDEQGEQASEVSIAKALENAETDAAVRARYVQGSRGRFVVALDPGHGGSDPGVQRVVNGVTYSERDIVLKIANFCKAELEKNGIEVCLTRTDNHSTLMNRKERTDYAVSKGASIIVSLHINSTSKTEDKASGSLVVVPNKNTESGKLSNELAAEILDKLEDLGLQNRGTTVDEELGMILYPKEYGIPGIIVEHAFLNNPSDVVNYLSSDAQLKKLGVADAQGILEYIKKNSEQSYDAQYYAPVFQAEYYANRYPDLKKYYGTNWGMYLKHFVEHGMKEGRQGNEEFNVQIYRQNYSDLSKVFKDDLEKYYDHYIRAGKKEGRNGKTLNTSGVKPENPSSDITVYEGRDYKDVFRAEYYANRYPDLKKYYGTNWGMYLKHFVEHGMKEGRQGSEEFSAQIYRENYSDLSKYYGTNWSLYYEHYMKAGKKEGRNGKTLLNAAAPGTPDTGLPEEDLTVYEGRDYKDVFNAKYYANRCADLKKYYGSDASKYLKHFVEYGMKEGRQGSEEFNVKVYSERYPDLKKYYGTNWELYYDHYMRAGKAEGRKAI